jgi:predicted RNA-binding protein with PIN domain
MPELTGKSLRSGRDGLVRFIRTKKPQGKNEVTVVFDGKSDIRNPQRATADINPVRNTNYLQKNKISNGVKIIFTKEVSADEKIKQLVEKSPRPNQIVVVTDDKEIRYCVRPCGAKVISVREFIGKVTEDKGKRSIEKTLLSSEEESKITKELEKIWLKG